MKITNCINCGASLKSNVCEYCGTEYEKKQIKKSFYEENKIELVSQNDNKITLNIHGKDIDFYIGDMEVMSSSYCDEVCYLTENRYKTYIPRHNNTIKITLISY